MQSRRVGLYGTRANPDPLLTPEQAAEWLTSSVRHLAHLRRTGRLPGVRIGRFVRYRASDLAAYVELVRDRNTELELAQLLLSEPVPDEPASAEQADEPAQ